MSDNLNSLKLKLQDRDLILPQNAMVELAPLAGLIVESHTNKWILGHKHWRNMRIPIVSFEHLAGGNLKSHSEYAKLAILSCSSASSQLPFWGLLVQGEPDELVLTEDTITAVDQPLGEAELMAVEVQGDRYCIPNLGFIETKLVNSLH